MSAPVPLEDLTGGRSIDPATIVVTRSAIKRFVDKHGPQTGGPGQQAQQQIRRLLADMLRSDYVRARPGREGRLRISMSGYRLVITSDLAAIVDYGTTHYERTWEDVKRGAPRSERGRQAERERHQRKVARRGERHRADMRQLVLDAGGQIEDQDDGSMLVTGPAGSFVLPPGGADTYRYAVLRREAYRDLADTTGLGDLREFGAEKHEQEETADTWLAID